MEVQTVCERIVLCLKIALFRAKLTSVLYSFDAKIPDGLKWDISSRFVHGVNIKLCIISNTIYP